MTASRYKHAFSNQCYFRVISPIHFYKRAVDGFSKEQHNRVYWTSHGPTSTASEIRAGTSAPESAPKSQAASQAICLAACTTACLTHSGELQSSSSAVGSVPESQEKMQTSSVNFGIRELKNVHMYHFVDQSYFCIRSFLLNLKNKMTRIV